MAPSRRPWKRWMFPCAEHMWLSKRVTKLYPWFWWWRWWWWAIMILYCESFSFFCKLLCYFLNKQQGIHILKIVPDQCRYCKVQIQCILMNKASRGKDTMKEKVVRQPISILATANQHITLLPPPPPPMPRPETEDTKQSVGLARRSPDVAIHKPYT